MFNEALDPNINELLEKIGQADKDNNPIVAEALRHCLEWYRKGYQAGMDSVEMAYEREQDLLINQL